MRVSDNRRAGDAFAGKGRLVSDYLYFHQSATMRVSGNRRLDDAFACKDRMVSDYLRLRDFVAFAFIFKGGPAGADDGTHRHHNPAAASATCSGSDTDSSSPEVAPESAVPEASWQPLLGSVPKRRRVGTSPTTGHAAPPRHPRRGPTEARQRPQHPRETGKNTRSGLVGDGDMSSKPSTASRVAPSQSQKAQQEAFIKWWTQRNPPAPPPPLASKDCQQGFLAQLAFTAAVIMGIRGGLNDLLSDWNGALKVISVLSLIVGTGALAAGLMATTSVVSTGYTRKVLSTCARFCTCLVAFMLIVDLSVLMGSHGYIAGTILGLVAVLFAVSVWIKGDPAAYGVYIRARMRTRHLCERFKRSRERGPILPL